MSEDEYKNIIRQNGGLTLHGGTRVENHLEIHFSAVML